MKEKRESTKSRMKRRTGPRSRAGRYFSSDLFIAWRIFCDVSPRAARWAAACSLRVRGTFARARAAASASLRVGVGRPLPPAFRSVVGVSGSELVRRNTRAAFTWLRNGHERDGRIWWWGPAYRRDPRGAASRDALPPPWVWF